MMEVVVIVHRFDATANLNADPALCATIDLVDYEEQLLGLAPLELTVIFGPLLADATDAAVAAFVDEEVRPRLDRLFNGYDDSPWRRVSTGHLQLRIMERWLPDL